MRIWRAAEFRAMPWKNGGGVSHEIATSPSGAGLSDFDWRISLADVAAGGPFSSFEGVDRVIVLLEGSSMHLTIDGRAHELAPGVPLAFSGDSVTVCELPDGPTRDLNLMTRRGRVEGAVQAHRLLGRLELPGSQDGEQLVLFVMAGTVMASQSDGPGARLGVHDAVESAAAGVLVLTGTATVVEIRLRVG